MGANPALTSPEIAALKANDADVPYFLTFAPEAVVATATVATTPTSDPIFQIATSGESGGWTNKLPGQMARFTDGSGNLLATYRVTKTSGAGTLYIGETALADVGLIPLQSRPHSIQAGDTITIYERYDLFSMKPFVDPASGITLQDGDVTPDHDRRTHPPNPWYMTINSQRGDFVTQVANGGTQAITAVMTKDIEWITNAGFTYFYDWTVPSSWTGVSGTTSATLTATAPVGAYYLYCKITPSLGDPVTFISFVRIHSPADPPIECNIISDPMTRNSGTMTLRLIENRANAIPMRGYCIVWSNGTWGGSDVPTARKKFCGYVANRPFEQQPGFYQSHVEIKGIGAVLDTVDAEAISFNALETASWEGLPSDLQNLWFIMFWVCYWRVSNLIQRFGMTPFQTTRLTAKQMLISAPKSSALAMLNRLAKRYRANVGSRSTGEIISQIHPSLSGSSVVTRATLDNTIYSNIVVTHQEEMQVGLVRLEGVVCDLVADTTVISQAPAEDIPGQHPSMDTNADNIFESQTHANQVAGDTFAMKNNPYPRIALDMPNNWDVFEMADMQEVDVVVAADKSPTGQQITIPCVPISSNKVWIPGRRAKTKLILEGITSGSAGRTITPASAIATSPTPTIGTSSGYGQENTYVPDGWFVGELRGLIILLSQATSTLTARDISPVGVKTPSNSLLMYRLKQDPWNLKGLFAFYSDAILTTADHTANPPVWTDLGVTPPSGYEWIWDFTGSINRQNYYAWIGRKNSDGSLRYYYTTDHFSTINHTDIPDSSWGSNTAIPYYGWNAGAAEMAGIYMPSFNTFSNGVVYFQNSNGKIWKSTDWGITWSLAYTNSYGTNLPTYMNIPYSLAGGAKNTTPTYIIRDDNNNMNPNFGMTNKIWRDGTNNFVLSPVLPDNKHWVASNQAMNSFTLDGNYAIIIMVDGTSNTGPYLVRTTDGGVTWTELAFTNRSGPYHGVNGWPTNKDFYVIWGGGGGLTGTMFYTTDGGQTQNDVLSAYNTATSAIRSSYPGTLQNMVIEVIPNLFAKYPVGGVHG